MGEIKLLTVCGTYLVEGRGVIVLPEIPVDSYSGARSRHVMLRKPDGQSMSANAILDIPYVTPRPPALY
jgi:hypothetical protein